MQEPQSTSTQNDVYNVVSVLYHSLREAQTCECYKQDAQSKGQQEIAQFFMDEQQAANKHAEQAKNLLSQIRSGR